MELFIQNINKKRCQRYIIRQKITKQKITSHIYVIQFFSMKNNICVMKINLYVKNVVQSQKMAGQKS